MSWRMRLNVHQPPKNPLPFVDLRATQRTSIVTFHKTQRCDIQHLQPGTHALLVIFVGKHKGAWESFKNTKAQGKAQRETTPFACRQK